MREPFFALYRDGVEISAGWKDLIISAEITDESGNEADKLMVELDDCDGRIEVPETGVVLRAVGGYVGEAAVVEGLFEIDQVDLEGWPQKMTLHGAAASANKAAKERRTRAYQPSNGFKTYGDVFDDIAKRNGWQARIAEELRNIPLAYEGQSGESDLAFATRIASKYAHLVAIKQGNLVATPRAGGKSVSGTELPAMTVAPGVNLLRYRVSWKDKPKHGKVEAHYFDREQAKCVSIETGDGDVAFRFREPFRDKDEAERAAEARHRELQRGEGSATFDIEGDASASAEVPVEASGIRARVDGRWNPKRVSHRWTTSGYTSTLECETPGKDGDGDGGEKSEEKSGGSSGGEKSNAAPPSDEAGESDAGAGDDTAAEGEEARDE